MEAVEYRGRDGLALQGLFFRAATPRAPVVVAVHGGAWRSGSAARYAHLGAYFAGAGLSTFAVTYRPAREGQRFPAQLHDLEAAIAHLVANAAAFDVDPARLGLVGDSAGAHLAALYALGAFPSPDARPVRAMVGIYGVYDLQAQFDYDLQHRTSDQITENLLGVSALDDRHAYFAASPMSYVTRRRPAPAFLIGWGTGDDVVDYERQSLAFLTALKRCGHVARSMPVAGAPHFWIEEPLDQPYGYAAAAAPRMLAFLKTQLAARG